MARAERGAEYWRVDVLNEGPAQVWETCSTGSIFKCPEHIREASPSCYDPKGLTLGPYAPKEDAKYASLNNQKINVARATLTSKNIPSDNRMAELVRELGGTRDELKKFGSEPNMNIRIEDVRRILAVDSLFVAGILVNIVLKTENYPPFVRTNRDHWEGCLKLFPGFGEDEPAYRAFHRDFNVICRDLLLLENQIPIPFLTTALKYAIPELTEERATRENWAEDLLTYSIRTVIEVVCFMVKMSENDDFGMKNIELRNCEHMLHFYHRVVTGGYNETVVRAQLGQRADVLGVLDNKLPSISELLSYRLKLKSEPGNITVAHFDNEASTIHLPRIIVNADTETLLRNLLAFEFLARKPAVVSSYVMFMVHLIETVSDVHIMRKQLVFEGFLGEDESVCKMWNRFTGGDLLVLKTRSDDVKDILNALKPINKQILDTYRQACSSLYLILSLIAAAILLVCTLLQTLYTVLDYNESFGG